MRSYHNHGSKQRRSKAAKAYDVDDLTSSFKGLFGGSSTSIKKHHDPQNPKYCTTYESINDGAYKRPSSPRLRKKISWGDGLPKSRWQIETAERKRKENKIYKWEAKQPLDPKDRVYFREVTPENDRLIKHMSRPKTFDEVQAEKTNNAKREEKTRKMKDKKAEDHERRQNALREAPENRKKLLERLGIR